MSPAFLLRRELSCLINLLNFCLFLLPGFLLWAESISKSSGSVCSHECETSQIMSKFKLEHLSLFLLDHPSHKLVSMMFAQYYKARFHTLKPHSFHSGLFNELVFTKKILENLHNDLSCFCFYWCTLVYYLRSETIKFWSICDGCTPFFPSAPHFFLPLYKCLFAIKLHCKV